uniref:NADH dehydrogenase subunit 4L n=1 Tax=Papilliphaedusa porphyrea TaxID=1885680 RepID=A0A224A0S2_9EUPU|nr:NADH dehydrogenase subunit 4L [Papilliphaedusa porphyrea]
MGFAYILSMLLVIMFLFLLTKGKHFLVGLLMLEGMMLLSLLILLFVMHLQLGGVNSFLLVLALSVCEAALGLSVLLGFVKIWGNDYTQQSISMS